MMDRRTFLGAMSAAALAGCVAPRRNSIAFACDRTPWRRVFARMPPALAACIDDPTHEVQILLSRIHRNADAALVTTHDQYGWAPQRWFPAMSMTKLPMALVAAEELSRRGLGLEVQLAPDPPSLSGEWPATEPESEVVARTMRRIFTVSENIPHNRLYDFIGPEAIQRRLVELGYPDARVVNRIGVPVGDGGVTRSGHVLSATGAQLAAWPARQFETRAFPYGKALAGRGWMEDDGRITPGPHDFSHGNFVPLADLHHMLLAMVLPEAVAPSRRWAIAEPIREEMLKIMAMLPRECADPAYGPDENYDGYARFFIFGDSHSNKPAGLHLVGKVGQAYGYLGDTEYVRDDASGAEFLLSAVICVNADGIFNDDKYEYDEVGIPFLAALGRAVLDDERERCQVSRNQSGRMR